jgi:hypothetical protein
MVKNYNRSRFLNAAKKLLISRVSMDLHLHSLARHLIQLQMEHADLDSQIDQAALSPFQDELHVRRLKKRRLLLRDQILRLEVELDPPQPA